MTCPSTGQGRCQLGLRRFVPKCPPRRLLFALTHNAERRHARAISSRSEDTDQQHPATFWPSTRMIAMGVLVALCGHARRGRRWAWRGRRRTTRTTKRRGGRRTDRLPRRWHPERRGQGGHQPRGEDRRRAQSAAAGAPAGAGALQLESLDLEHNAASVEGAASLADALADNEALRTLRLGHNCPCDEGVGALGPCLRENATLTCTSRATAWAWRASRRWRRRRRATSASRRSTSRTTTCARRARGTWRSCRAARRRSRRCCSAATTPAQRAPPLLADALTNNGYLTALDLRMNGASNEGVCLLADALKTNATLLRPGAAIDERR